MKKPTATFHTQSGIALIAVLWMSVLLALISTAANRVSRTDVVTALNTRSRLAAQNAVDSAIDVAIFTYMTGQEGAWHVNGTPYGWVMDDVEVRVSLSDENWRVDLNTASEDVLKDMLTRLGIAENDADFYVKEIMAHREKSRSTQRNTATEAQLRDAGHFAFGLVEDIQTVTGMNGQLAQRIVREATVYSGLATPAPRGQRARFGQLGGEDIVLSVRPQPLVNLLEAPDGRSSMLRIQAEARTAEGAYFAKEIVVTLASDDAPRPYQVRLQRRSDNKLFNVGN